MVCKNDVTESGKNESLIGVRTLAVRREDKLAEARKIIRELVRYGYAENFIYLLEKLRLLVLVDDVRQEDGSELISEKEIKALEAKHYGGAADYYCLCLMNKCAMYDPDETFRKMKKYNKKGVAKLSQEMIEEAIRGVAAIRIVRAQWILDEAIRRKSEYPSNCHKKIQQLLVYMKEHGISYRHLTLSKEEILRLNSGV